MQVPANSSENKDESDRLGTPAEGESAHPAGGPEQDLAFGEGGTQGAARKAPETACELSP
jgi:hypothetical protein